ncbi:MAG TPA: methyltransferase domain-containing protein [Thermoanaerobaculia bacterium]|nr:methyltransferase domain-containing protein [Thermoanaerobaculia bacterium]
MHDSLWRARNGLRRLVAGLPPAGGPVSPEAPTAVFAALSSIYRFAGRFVAGKAVLDWGCGTGFGSAILGAAGAGSVVGVDPDAAAIRYARRRFAGPGVGFRSGALEPAGPDLPPFERLVAVGTLARLRDPEAALPALAGAMGPEGLLVASVPPLLDGQTLELHLARHPGAARLYLWDWADLLGRRFRELRLYAHQPPAGVELDLASPRPSPLDPESFRFEEVPLSDLDNVGTLGAVFVGVGPGR